MRKALLVLFLASVIISAFTSSSNAQYTIHKIADNFAWNGFMISNGGQIVWVGSTGSDDEVFLYDGTNTIQFTDNDTYENWALINEVSQVAWTACDGGSGSDCTGGDYEVFLYDGTTSIQLTDNSVEDRLAWLNDDGWVLWKSWDGSDYEIFLYDGTSTVQITDNDHEDRGAQMNNNGQVVWLFNDGDYEVLLHNGTDTIQLTDNSTSEQLGLRGINDDGWVVWSGSDGSDDEIYLYDGASINQLTDNAYYEGYPHLNNSGQVAWVTEDHHIFFYDGTSVMQIPHLWDSWNPYLNDSGHMVWTSCVDGDEDLGCGGDGHYEVFVYDGSSPLQITNTYVGSYAGLMNNSGEIVWVDYWNGLFLGVPCAHNNDNDADGYPSTACGGTDCDDFNPQVHRMRPEICGNGIDDNCDGSIDPSWPCTTTAEASLVYGTKTNECSSVFNNLALLLIPAGALLFLRILRRKK